jgi:Ser/Thr protein kinase RdoA (MazF antagonist)
VEWVDERLAAAGIERTGEVEQPHLRPWATVLKVPTAAGPVWFKAAAPGTAFEAALYELLARAVPEHVLTPLGVDTERAWLLLPDGGPPIGERLEGAERMEALVAAIVEYGRVQRALEPHLDELLAIGVADMRPAAMPERFEQALAAASALVGAEKLTHIAAMRDTVARWCERLAASPLPPSLDHNDLHPWNVLGGARFYDWGDSVVAHPFAAMLVPLGFVQRGLDAELDDPRFTRARDAYLGVFADLAPHEELVETLELACRVAKIARALTWERALRSAREQGEEVEPYFAAAPAETLASLADDSYLGGG